MTTEQFTQVVDAILEGKYSWACVLILRFAGYNPLHYIPYRTYNRLMKENSPMLDRSYQKKVAIESRANNSAHSEDSKAGRLHAIKDLGCLEVLNDSQRTPSEIRGGNSLKWQSNWYRDELKYG